jgi:uncharacterized protein
MARMGLARVAIFSIAIALFVSIAPARAQGLQPVPELTARVIDETGTLDPIQRKGLDDKLAAFEQAKGTQVAFLIVATTQPEDIAAYANRVGNAWKIGRKEVGDGVLLVVAKNDRKVRIEVAKTLEGAIPDLAAKRIIDEAITPRFREGDFAGGLQAAADRIVALASGEQLPAPQQPSVRERASAGFDWFDLAIFLFFAVPIGGAVLRGVLGRKLGALATGAGVGAIALFVTSSLLVAMAAAFVALAFALFSSGFGGTPRRSSRGGWGAGPWIGTGGGWGSGSSGGSWGGGGGGFSSGGGGDFGGGGASGDW